MRRRLFTCVKKLTERYPLPNLLFAFPTVFMFPYLQQDQCLYYFAFYLMLRPTLPSLSHLPPLSINLSLSLFLVLAFSPCSCFTPLHPQWSLPCESTCPHLTSLGLIAFISHWDGSTTDTGAEIQIKLQMLSFCGLSHRRLLLSMSLFLTILTASFNFFYC